MRASISVKTTGLIKSLKNIKLTEKELLDIFGAGAKVLINEQRRLVPVDTGATRASINSHIQEVTDTRVVDEIGPETNYAPVIEYGRADMPNYPMQPFIRPATENAREQVNRVVSIAFGQIVKSRWQI